MRLDRRCCNPIFSVLFAAVLLAVGCKDSASTSDDNTTPSLDAFGCEQECVLELYSPCTCGPDDPCGWKKDGTCDRKCLFNGIVEEMFDDAADCPGACMGACLAGFYTTCSCGQDDPCGWAEDDDCDILCLMEQTVEVMFDDRVDCPGYLDDGGM